MTRQLLVPADYGIPVELGSIDTDPQVLEKIWSGVLHQFDNDSASSSDMPATCSQSALDPEVTIRLSRTEAKKRKDEFINILLAWDEEHDRIAETAKSHKLRGTFLNGKSNLVAQVRADISGTHSWGEVFDALRDAEEAYNNPKGINVVHKWCRKAADKAELVEPFVDFIPNFDFSSVVCGGIKFILRACTASKKFREEAFELINQLPEKVDITGQYLELYREEAQLQVASYKLFCDILSAIESILYWLTKDHTFEWLKPLVQQSTYNSKFKENIKQLGQASAHVAEIVRLCNNKRLSEVSEGVGQIRQDVGMLRKFLEACMRAMFQQAKWYLELQQCKNNLTGQSLQEEPEETISHKELLLLLDPNATTVQCGHERILQGIIRNGLAMDTEAQKRVEWLMANKSIGRWFTSTKSRSLLVNGCGSLDPVSPMSLFCAMLVQSLKSIGSIIILNHFCGLEKPETGSHGSRDQGSSGLLKSLLIQLLAQWKTSVITCFDHDLMEDLKSTSPNWNLRQQRKLLRLLVAALPPATPLFIIIDGTNYYEIDGLCGETKRVVKELANLRSLESVEAMVKVLLTSPTRSYNLPTYFRSEEIVLVPEDMDDVTTRFADSRLQVRFTSKTAARLDRSLSRNRQR